jgi:hypothetical protein
MLDAGRSLDSARRAIVARMAGAEPSEWDAGDVRSVKEGVEASANGIPLKRLYGSDFPFDTSLNVEYSNAGARPSYAVGGLSTVWGAGMLPFHPDDIADWPVPQSEMEPAYRAVLSFVPCSGSHDDIAELFPLYCDEPSSLRRLDKGRRFCATRRVPVMVCNAAELLSGSRGLRWKAHRAGAAACASTAALMD